MDRITRWRLTWWLSGSPDKTRSQWYSHKCKLCAAKRAQALAYVMADLARADHGTSRWSIARVIGHLTEPVIVGNSSTIGDTLLKRHAC